MADETSPETTHDLLLALAGRVDDDLLAWARELTAVGEDAHAVELVTASLIASRTALPRTVHAALAAAARSARTGLDPSVLPTSSAEDGTEHRFVEASDDDPVAGALLDLPARPLEGCHLLLTRRLTPAGSAPGPLPHPVVLVQVPPDGRPTDVLAYQLAVALERAGVRVSVEVLTDGSELSAYHAAALHSALHSAVHVRSEHADEHIRDRRPAPRPAPLVEPDVEPDAERSTTRVPDTAKLQSPPLRTGEQLDRYPPREQYPYEPEPIGAVDDDEHVGVRHDEIAHRELAYDESGYDEAGYDEIGYDEIGYEERYPDFPEPTAHEGDEPDDPTATTSTLPATPGRGVPPTSEVSFSGEEPEREPAHPSGGEPPAPRPHVATQPQAIQQPGQARPMPVHEQPVPRPLPRPTPLPSPTGRTQRPAVTPISRTTVPNPVPVIRRDGPTPVQRPHEPVDEAHDDKVEEEPPLEPPLDDSAPEAAPAPEPVHEAEPARAEPSLFEPLRDALNGPLNEPLLAPLLEPTILEEDPLGLGERPIEDESVRDEPDAELAVAQERDIEPEPAEDDAEWSAEWLSGTWAMAPSAFESGRRDRGRDSDLPTGPEPDDDQPVDDGQTSTIETDPPSPRPVPRRAARHRYADELDDRARGDEPTSDERRHDDFEPLDEHPADRPHTGPDDHREDDQVEDGPDGYPEDDSQQGHHEPQAAEQPEPASRDTSRSSDLGLRPESLARLSDADRQLLARLQAELLDGRNPRFGGRAGVTNGSPRGGAGPNGSRRADPPDLAG